MVRRVALGFVGVAAIAAVFMGIVHCHTATAEAAPTPAPVSANATPILVELFTSEGCSSCPSADEVAAKLERTQPAAGARIIVLAHHVDYWDRLGWPDPWSSSAATARQRSFAPLKSGSYTPQAVVDGRSETVGSRQAAIELMVTEAAKTAHVPVDLDVTRSEKNVLDVNVKTNAPTDADVLIAVVQDRGRTSVPAGENSGRTLNHTAIVRTMTTGPRARLTVPATINAPDGTTFSIVAFVQERSSRKILGSTTTRL